MLAGRDLKCYLGQNGVGHDNGGVAVTTAIKMRWARHAQCTRFGTTDTLVTGLGVEPIEEEQ